MAADVEICAKSILGRRSAVPDSAPAMGQEAQQGARLPGKRVVPAVAGGVKPLDFPC